MHPIFDTTLLRHHRVDYGPHIDTEGVRRPKGFGRTVALVMIAVIALGITSSFVA